MVSARAIAREWALAFLAVWAPILGAIVAASVIW